MTAVVLIFSKRGGPATWHAATCPVVAKCDGSRAHAVIRDELPYHADDLTERGYRLKRCPCCTAADVERARSVAGCSCGAVFATTEAAHEHECPLPTAEHD